MAALVVTLWIVTGFFLLRRVLARGARDTIFANAALCAGLLTAAHAMVDFSIQIAGFGIVISGLVGCGLAQTIGTRERARLNASGQAAGTERLA